MKFEAIILEGADCCGKTSFANELLKKYDNAILVHFPRVNGNEKLKTAIDNLTRYLYNKNYIETFINLGKYQLPFDYETQFDNMVDILLESMVQNIEENYNDKMIFLNILEIIQYKFNECKQKFSYKKIEDIYVDKFKSEFFRLLENDACVDVKLDGKSIKNSSNPSIIFDSFIENELINNNTNRTIYVIFDRFFMSGDVYNYIVPVTLFKSYINEIFDERSKISQNVIKSLYKDENECKFNLTTLDFKLKDYRANINNRIEFNLEDKQISCTKNIIKKCNDIFNKHNLSRYENLFNKDSCVYINGITNIIFETNNKLVEISKKDENRKFDEYDQNYCIQLISRSAFENYIHGSYNEGNEKDKKIMKYFKETYNILENYTIKNSTINSDEYLEFETTEKYIRVKQNDDKFKSIIKRFEENKNSDILRVNELLFDIHKRIEHFNDFINNITYIGKKYDKVEKADN